MCLTASVCEPDSQIEIRHTGAVLEAARLVDAVSRAVEFCDEILGEHSRTHLVLPCRRLSQERIRVMR